MDDPVAAWRVQSQTAARPFCLPNSCAGRGGESELHRVKSVAALGILFALWLNLSTRYGTGVRIVGILDQEALTRNGASSAGGDHMGSFCQVLELLWTWDDGGQQGL